VDFSGKVLELGGLEEFFVYAERGRAGFDYLR